MNAETERLSKKITPERLLKMKRVLEMRTRKICVVLEDVFQPHNAAAVLRNCDAFGIQDAYFIENRYIQRISSNVDAGASKWLTIRRFVSGEAVLPRNGISHSGPLPSAVEENTLRALRHIRQKGYSIAVSTLRAGALSLDEIPADRPVALLMGTERAGASQAAHSQADFFFSVKMSGFVQSFNLSVFSALCLDNLTKRMRALDDTWRLSDSEKEELLFEWLSSSCRGFESQP